MDITLHCSEFECLGMYKDKEEQNGKMYLKLTNVDITEEPDDITTAVLNSLSIQEIIERVGIHEIWADPYFTEVLAELEEQQLLEV
jgi:hypothetical protein